MKNGLVMVVLWVVLCALVFVSAIFVRVESAAQARLSDEEKELIRQADKAFVVEWVIANAQQEALDALVKAIKDKYALPELKRAKTLLERHGLDTSEVSARLSSLQSDGPMEP
jgi:uncharacterized membrane protein